MEVHVTINMYGDAKFSIYYNALKYGGTCVYIGRFTWKYIHLNQKLCFWKINFNILIIKIFHKMYFKISIKRAPSGFELMTCRSVALRYAGKYWCSANKILFRWYHPQHWRYKISVLARQWDKISILPG